MHFVTAGFIPAGQARMEGSFPNHNRYPLENPRFRCSPLVILPAEPRSPCGYVDNGYIARRFENYAGGSPGTITIQPTLNLSVTMP